MHIPLQGIKSKFNIKEMETEKPNIIDITGDGKLTKEILVEGQGEPPQNKQYVDGKNILSLILIL